MDEIKGIFEKYTGQETDLEVPETVSSKPLAIIASKAFLSCKTIERLVLPPTLETVEDWGFAHMKNLREIVLPAKEICFGKQVFLGCDGLEKVVFYEVEDASEKKSVAPKLEKLFASMLRFFPTEDLVNPVLVRTEEGQNTWISGYDEALDLYLKKPDDSGFEPAFIGWFDVEDVDDQKERFILQRKQDKIKLSFQRLLHEHDMKEELRAYLTKIIFTYTDLVEKWLCEDEICGSDVRYYKVWHRSGVLDAEFARTLLDHLPWEEPEVRAYLMELAADTKEDFFKGLSL